MYNMSRVNANGYFDSENNEDVRYEKKKSLNNQRTIDYQNNSYARAGGVADPIPEDATEFLKDYNTYYKTKRELDIDEKGIGNEKQAGVSPSLAQA